VTGQETNLKIKPHFVEKYKGGYPLLTSDTIEDINTLTQEGTIINLFDSKKKFIAKGYFGKQNKGLGWVLSNKKNQNFAKEFFADKIKTAIKNRESFFNDTNTTAFRVFNDAGDGVGGITIDYFDGYYLITWYSLGIYQFKKEIIDALKSSVEYKGIYQKRRFADNGQYVEDKDFICGEVAPEPLIIKENGVNFAIYLDDGPMVGIFLDQKDVRKTLRDKYSQRKTVLNTFSYTGAFSVYATLGGATKTTSVDLANRSLPKTSEQFSINGIDPKTQEIIVKDVFLFFKQAVKQKLSYDVVVVDPPSFARSKKHTFSVSKDYVKLLKEIIQITNKNGVIVASTNYAGISLSKFKEFIDKAFKQSNTKYKIEQTFSMSKDFHVDNNFREGAYLKVVFIKKL
jgi:23S rRNA (cytosine1962-C5)-methyltransferase